MQKMPAARLYRFAILIAALALAAPTAYAEGLLAKVQQKGVLVIGTSNDAPLSYVDESTKKAAGVLPDILREFFKRQNIKASIQVVAMPFASR
jgi:ABC-type amino acid transport substrate-binding protein